MGIGAWGVRDIGDLSGQVAVVTGGNAGLGLSTVRELASHGAQVVLASRSVERGEHALATLPAQVRPYVDVQRLDLADLGSVRAFADQVKTRHTRLNLLINNAGIMMVPAQLTVDGFEMQIGTNHFGHFALTGLLLDVLTATQHARVVTVSSLAHRRGVIKAGTVEQVHEIPATYSPVSAYGRSKLANLLFAYELQRRLAGSQVSVSSLAAHPGVSATGLGEHLIPQRARSVARPALSVLAQSPDAGALPTLRAATDPGALGGQYYGPDRWGQTRGAPVPVASNAASYDPVVAAELWEVSQRLTGVTFG